MRACSAKTVAATVAIATTLFAPHALTATEPSSPNSFHLHIDPTAVQQTFEGWGVTLAWSGNYLIPGHGKLDNWNQWNKVMEAIYDRGHLGFNIIRYNIGGGENPAYRYLFNGNPDFMMAGFESADLNWNWSVDQGQIAMMKKAQALGVDIFEAFSNSPPYYMLKSQSVTGAPWVEDQLKGESGASDNLLDDHYTDFANYLVEVVQHFHDSYGITFRTLDPVNEPRPETKYWLFKQGYPTGKVQEGCHFSVANQNRIMIETAKALRARGLSTEVSGPDETSIDFTRTSFLGYSQAGQASLAQINTHSYIDGDRVALKNLAASNGKRLWMSEDGWPYPGLDNALILASHIVADVKTLGAQAWILWQPDAGLMAFPGHGKVVLQQGYYAVEQYSHFIRPGSLILEDTSVGSDPDTLVAYHPGLHRLILVTLNQDKSNRKTIDVDLSRFKNIGSTAKFYLTDSKHNLERRPDHAVTHQRLHYMASAQSITTVEIKADRD